MDILGIDHVVLRVRDMDRALAFYRDLLGCREERRIDSLGMVQLRAGRALIDMVPAADAPPPGRGNMDHLALRVADLEALLGRLRAAGVAVGEVVWRYGAEGDGPSAYVSDPDGNGVELKGAAPG